MAWQGLIALIAIVLAIAIAVRSRSLPWVVAALVILALFLASIRALGLALTGH